MSSLPWFVEHPRPDIYTTGTPLFLDFETTTHGNGLAIYKENRIILACWKHGWDGEIQSKWAGEFDLGELVAACYEASFLVAHNAKFELQWLERCGLDLSRVLVYDTMIADYVIGGNRWQTGHLSLESCAARHGLEGKLSLVSKMIKSGVPTEDIPAIWLEQYCKRDVALLPELMMAQLTDMAGTRLLPVVYSRCLLTPVLADIETKGLKLDGDLVRKRLETLERDYEALTIELNRRTGGINLNSPLQLAVFLYDTLGFEELVVRRGRKWEPKRTKTGRRATDADTILALKPTNAAQREFKDLFTRHREAYSQLTKYIRKWGECVEKNNGILLAKFNQTQTQTHRLSSSGLDYKTQLQNLPRQYKELFMAKEEGWYVGEVDGAQLEFRIAAHLGNDYAALADILAKVDVHAFTARTLTEAGQATDRQGAKEHTFKPLYGGSSGTEAEQAYYRAFKAKYPGITKTQGEWINTVLMEKSLETQWGLRYYWPDTKMDASGYITNTTSICNYPVQAMATAEIIPLALVCFWHRLHRMDDPGVVLINTVHDSIIAEIRPGSEELFHELSQQCLIRDAEHMMRELYGIDMICPLGCGVKIGTHWGKGTEVKYEQEELKNGTEN